MIKDENQQGGFAQQNNSQFAAQPQGAAGASASIIDFSELMTTGSALFSPRSASENLEKATNAVRDFLKSKFNGEMPKDWHLIKIDATVHNLPASVLAIATVARSAQNSRVFVTNLLLESTKVNLAQTQAQGEGGRTLVITTTLGQAFDDRAWAIVQKRVADSVNVSEAAVQETGTLIVPKSFDMQDPEQLGRLVYLGTVASAIGRTGGTKLKFNLANVALANKRFVTDIDFSAQPKVDLLGRPVRNDINVVTSVQSQSDRNASYQQESQLVDLSAYVDLNYTQPVPVPPAYPGAAPQMSTQIYRPEIVVSDQRCGFDDFDLCRSLFVLNSASALEKGSQWIRYFMRNLGTKKGQINIHDIGAIGLELQVTGGKPIPTGRDVFTTENLAELIGTYIHQNPLVSMDIDPTGPYSWVLNDYVWAGMGDKDAEARILEAANVLTNNQFKNYWNGGVICQVRQTLHAGTFVNEANEVVGLDQIGYLAALNIFGLTDAESFKRWADSFENVNMTDIERLAVREEILRGQLSSVEITGYKRRVTFNKDFLIALEKALFAVGYHPNPKNTQPVFGPQVQRGQAGLDALAGQGGWGQTLYSGQQQTIRGGGNVSGRFTRFGG